MRAIAFILGLTMTVAAAPAVAQKAPAKPKAPAAQPKAPSAPARLYDFKGVPLGITMAEFRQLPHPDGDASAQVICTGEKVQITSGYEREPYEVAIYSETEKSLGIKKCIWIDTSDQLGLSGRPKGLSLAGSGYATYDYSFSFIPDPKDGELRLYKFVGTSNRNATDDIVKALTSKWGAPKITHDTVQNRMGASFDQVTARWINPLASLMVQDRFSKIDDLGIIMQDLRLSTIVVKADEARKAATPNSI